MNVVTGQVQSWTVSFNQERGDKASWGLKGRAMIRPEIMFRQDSAVFPSGTLPGPQSGSAGEAFNPIKMSGWVDVEFLDVAPPDGELGWIVTGDRVVEWQLTEGYAAHGHCYLYAPELSENIKGRHASAGVMPKLIELDVEGLEAGVNNKGEPLLLWDRLAVPKLRVLEVTVHMVAVEYLDGWRFV